MPLCMAESCIAATTHPNLTPYRTLTKTDRKLEGIGPKHRTEIPGCKGQDPGGSGSACLMTHRSICRVKIIRVTGVQILLFELGWRCWIQLWSFRNAFRSWITWSSAPCFRLEVDLIASSEHVQYISHLSPELGQVEHQPGVAVCMQNSAFSPAIKSNRGKGSEKIVDLMAEVRALVWIAVIILHQLNDILAQWTQQSWRATLFPSPELLTSTSKAGNCGGFPGHSYWEKMKEGRKVWGDTM